MGQLFGQGLTVPNSAITDPNTGQTSIGKPSDVLGATAGPIAARANAQEMSNVFGTPNQAQALPIVRTPSTQEAAGAGALPGGANVLSPGLNKAGKLAVLLNSGLQGALAGRAANEQATVASGGRRSGGAGMGFEAGYQLPWQRAMLPLGLEKEQAQTQLLRAQSEMVPTQYGMMPAALARFILPAQIRGEAEVTGKQIGAGATTQAAATRAQGQVASAEVGQRFKAVPGVGLFDTQSRQVIPGTSQNITITPEIAQDYQLPNEFIGKPMNVQQLSSIERAMNGQVVPVAGEGGTSLVTKTGPNAGKTQNLGLGNPAMGRPTQIGDPNNPGQTTFTTGGQAVRTGAAGPQSASVQVPRAAARAEVPTKIGDQRIAFTTMIQHAELLRQAARALNNGDVQTLSGLENAFKNEFGYSGPITAKAIADAYGGEVTNVISKGHITDAEMAKTGKTLDPSKQNFETVNNVLNAYQALAQSKMNMLNQQKNNAINQSQPKNSKNSGNDPVSQLIQKHAPTTAAAPAAR